MVTFFLQSIFGSVILVSNLMNVTGVLISNGMCVCVRVCVSVCEDTSEDKKRSCARLIY